MGRRRKADRAEPGCRLVRFDATDGLGLVGLLYEPRRRSDQVIIFLHGTGGASIFDAKRTNLLAATFTERGLAFFPFNNRGAHIVRRSKTRSGRSVPTGSAHERIADCVADIDGAIAEMRRRGYRDITLVGHSTGANKIAVYNARKQRSFARRFVLLAGGDDTGLLYQTLGPRRFRSALAKARQKRHSHELVPESWGVGMLSWRAFHDVANPDGDYNVFPFLEILRGIRLSRKARFRHLRTIRKPALVIYGENDEYCYDDVSGCVAVLADALSERTQFEYVILGDADHGFGGHEAELGKLIADWVTLSF